MAISAANNDFIVWGLDQAAYGPVELPTLVNWVKDERVQSDTWIFTCKDGSWQRAGDVPELQMFFAQRPGAEGAQVPIARTGGVSGRQLRRIKILATMSDDHLERLARVAELEKVPQWTVVVAQGDPGDAMYLVLEGELRVRVNVLDKESILATLGAGDFFGDIAVFDHGPRSADVVANTDAVLVKLSSKAMDDLGRESPELVASFFKAVGRTLTARIRANNKRHSDAVKFARASSQR